MRPYKNRLLIEPRESESVLVSADTKFQSIGEVKAIGYRPWYLFWKPRFVRVGDIVAFNIWGIDRIEISGKEYFFLLEDEDFLLARL